MKKISLFIFCIVSLVGHAQTDSIYISNGELLYTFPGDSISSWGNMTNNGSLGSNNGAIWIHYAEVWTNDTLALMPQTSNGGTFSFIQPRPAPYSNNSIQFISGGHHHLNSLGCSFPNMYIQNSENIHLLYTDTKVRSNLTFDTGKVVLKGHSFTVGNGNPGSIMGYNQNKYFVNGGDTSGGYLVRENIYNIHGAVDFPVGTSISSYSPASIYNRGAADTFKVRVFDDVYSYGTQGGLQNVVSVGKTWDAQERNAGGSDVYLTLEHEALTEGSGYNRNSQYISEYIGTANNTHGGANSQNSLWDLVPSNFCTDNTTQGYLTSGSPIAMAYDTTRRFDNDSDFNIFHYFTKATCNMLLPVSYLNSTLNWHQSDRKALLQWSTASEINCDGYYIERQLKDELVFKPIGWMPSQGKTSEISQYQFSDFYYGELGNYAGAAHYRITQIDLTGGSETHAPQSIYIQTNKPNVNIWPNPATDQINIYLSAETPASEATISDISGKILKRITLGSNGSQQISLHDLSSGMYILSIYSINGKESYKIEKL
jgi:hypothetical protein